MRARILAFLALTSLLSTALIAGIAVGDEVQALPGVALPGVACKEPASLQCVMQTCGVVTGQYGCVPAVSEKCLQAPTACVPVGCSVSMMRYAFATCMDAACFGLNQAGEPCSASEILCKDVTPLYQQVVVPPVGGAANQILGLLGGAPSTGLPIVRNVLVRAAFYCDPPDPGQGGTGSGCQEVVTTVPGQVGLRDFTFHDVGLSSFVKGNDCAWLRSDATGWLYIATDGWTGNFVDVPGDGSDCQTAVRLAIQEFGLGFGSHSESFRFVYC